MRTLLLLALVSGTASAQGPVYNAARFAPPLQVGNRWEYVEADHYATPPRPYRLHVYAVTGDIQIGGETYFVLTGRDFTPAGTPEGPLRHCATSRAAGDAPAGTTGLPDYDCSYFGVMRVPAPHTSGPTTVTANVTLDISGQSVTVDSTLGFSTSSQGSGGAYGYTSTIRATGIGYVSYRSSGERHAQFCNDPGEPSCSYDTRWSLAYARLGNVVYGAAVVAGESAATPSPSFTLSASPNPFTSEVSVTATGASGPVAVDVYDALGRRVAGSVVEGGAPFGFRPSAAGVYVVRAHDAAGRTATRRVVRR